MELVHRLMAEWNRCTASADLRRPLRGWRGAEQSVRHRSRLPSGSRLRLQCAESCKWCIQTLQVRVDLSRSVWSVSEWGFCRVPESPGFPEKKLMFDAD